MLRQNLDEISSFAGPVDNDGEYDEHNGTNYGKNTHLLPGFLLQGRKEKKEGGLLLRMSQTSENKGKNGSPGK